MSTPLSGPFEVLDLPEGGKAPLYIIRFDKAGVCESPRARESLLTDLKGGGYSDFFLFSHGWNNTWDDALDRYHQFFSGYLALRRERGTSYPRKVRPLLAGVFWPSTALTTSAERGPAIAAAPDAGVPEALLHELAGGLSWKDAAWLEAIVRRPQPLGPDEALQLARLLLPLYARGDDETAAAAGAETPEEVVRIWQEAAAEEAPPDDTGEGGFARDAGTPGTQAGAPQAAGLLSRLDPRPVLRLATVLQMKDRAGVVGSRGVGPLLAEALAAGAPRVHLAGHSYGCKVMLSALCGDDFPEGSQVESALLLQPAVNHRCFAADVGNGRPGGYLPAFDRVRQPILATHSRQDFPLTHVFHLAARRRSDLGELRAAPGEPTCAGLVPPSQYAALGGYGPGRCRPGECKKAVLRAPGEQYDLAPGEVKIMALNGDGPITGHGDIAIPHTYWAMYNQVVQSRPDPAPAAPPPGAT
jgi:hypothetical protein